MLNEKVDGTAKAVPLQNYLCSEFQIGMQRLEIEMAKMKSLADQSDWGCDIHGRDAARRGVTRRGFMKGGALALIGTSTIPAFLSRSVLA
jgi:hypothetical protein